MSYKVFFTFIKKDGKKILYDFSKSNKIKIDFFYKNLIIEIQSTTNVNHLNIAWNNFDQNIVVPQFYFDDESVYRSSSSPILKDPFAINHTDPKLYRYLITLDEKSFISHLLFGVFDLYLTNAAEKEFIGQVIRNRFVGIEGKSYRYFENILNTVMKNGTSFIFSLRKRKSLFRMSPSSNLGEFDMGYLFKLSENYVTSLELLNYRVVDIPGLVSVGRKFRRISRSVRLDAEAIKSISRININQKYLQSSTEYLNISLASPLSVSAPESVNTFNIQENRVLHAQGRRLYKILSHLSSLAIFEIPFISDLISRLDYNLKLFNNRCSLIENFDEPYSPPLKYLYSEDPALRKIGSLVQQTNYLGLPNDMESNFHFDFTIPSTDKLWEYFCLESICRAIYQLGYTSSTKLDDHIEFKDPDQPDANICIFFDMQLEAGGSTKFVTNLDSNAKRPDFLVLYSKRELKKVLVFDAKFTINREFWRSRALEIFSKYGLWLRKNGYEMIDSCYALVPSVNSAERSSSHSIEHIGRELDLGYLSLMMDEDDKKGIEIIKQLF